MIAVSRKFLRGCSPWDTSVNFPHLFPSLGYGVAHRDISFWQDAIFTMSLYPKKTTTCSIASLANLSAAFGLSLEELEQIRAIPEPERYQEKTINKGNGKKRIVFNPCFKIRLIQNLINKRLFKQLVSWPEYLFGSLPNSQYNGVEFSRDYIACAKVHCGAKSIYKIDISDFFDNIHRDFVFDIFSNLFSYPDEVAKYLTDVCCYRDRLPQGALTSSYIATACFYNTEGDVVKRLSRKGLRYTRLVDDITVSTERKDYDFSYVDRHIRDMLIDKDLPVNDSKTYAQYSGMAPLLVHGLRVEYKQPRLPAKEVANIRASVHNIVSWAKVDSYRTSHTYRASFDRCLGRVNKLARVGHQKHKLYVNKLRKVSPLPSASDIAIAERSISRLEKISHPKLKHPRYERFINLARYRISIIKRRFPSTAALFSQRLRAIEARRNADI